MSGHSKWDNIKHRKGAQDERRGKVFSKMARLITISVKEGNGSDPTFNAKLFQAIERAKAENMPKDNIQRAIENAVKKKDAIEEMVMEGYGIDGAAIIVEILTDNRQRTIQEVRNIFTRTGGSVAEPGSVSFQFDRKGLIEVSEITDENLLLQVIDAGAEDIESDGGVSTIWVNPSDLESVKQRVSSIGINIAKTDLVLKPKSLIVIDDKVKAKKMIDLLETLEDHDDVQRVFTNVEILDGVLDSVND